MSSRNGRSRWQAFATPGLRLALISMAAGLLAAPSVACAQDDFGVLVMAHGGGPKWNGEVAAMLEPLRAEQPLEIAFGMADAISLQEGVRRLEAQGVRRVAVVRLFISGASWFERTEQILGLRPGAPPRPAASQAEVHTGHGGHSMAFWRINSDAAFALSTEGLSEAPETGAVLAERARALSRDPTRESVLILAHGPEDDAENQRWLAEIDRRAEAVRQDAPFRTVRVETLREDWPEKRKAAETRIRAFVEESSQEDGQVIVIPYRVSGFGPYAKVLDGLSYVSDGRGLLPSPEVAGWVRRQIAALEGGPSKTPDAAPVPQVGATFHVH